VSKTRIWIEKSLFIALVPLAFSVASAEFPPAEDQPLALQRTGVVTESYDAGGTMTLEQIERYARDIVPADTFAAEKARVEAGLADKLGAENCQDAVVRVFEGASNCVRSMSENGELVRQYVEAKLFLEQAKWRVTGGAHALVQARALVNFDDAERFRKMQEKGAPIYEWTLQLADRVERVQRGADNARKRYDRAVAARDAIARRVPVLRQILVVRGVLRRHHNVWAGGMRYEFDGIKEGVDYVAVPGLCLGKRAC